MRASTGAFVIGEDFVNLVARYRDDYGVGEGRKEVTREG